MLKVTVSLSVEVHEVGRGSEFTLYRYFIPLENNFFGQIQHQNLGQ